MSSTISPPNTSNGSETANAANNLTMAASHASSPRRILSDVSPNVKRVGNAPAFLFKPLAGSPLKRSFAAAMEEGEGMTYLKRRRLGDDEALSDVANAARPYAQEQPVPTPRTDEQTSCISLVEVPPSPTEPDSTSEGDDSTQQSSAERKSFSSLINYDPSSQTSNSAMVKTSKGELLRLRLRMAMYKVRTEQVGKPFAQLEESSIPRETTYEQTVAEAVADLRREAMEVLARDARSLIPEPDSDIVHHPTARNSITLDSSISSLLVKIESPTKLHVAVTARTPLRESWNATPPRSVQRKIAPSEQELTSSAVKGRVAEGLLGLRNSTYSLS